MTRLKNLLQEYLEANLEYYKISGFEKLMQLIVALVFLFSLLLVGFFALFFLAMAAAIWMEDLFINPALGYLIVAVFFILLIGIVFLLRKSLFEKPLIRTFSSRLLKTNEIKKPD